MNKNLLFIILFAAGFAYAQQYYTFTSNTGSNATIAIPLSIQPRAGGSLLQNGDEIAVYTPAGRCAGAVVWTGNSNVALTAWGDDPLTTVVDGFAAGEIMTFKVWRKSVNREYIASTVSYSTGNQLYSTNGIYVLSQLEANTVNVEGEEKTVSTKLHQNYPNPFRESTTFSFDLSERGYVSVVMYNLLGKKVKTLIAGERGIGTHSVQLNAADDNIPAGVYIVKMTVNGYSASRKITAIK